MEYHPDEWTIIKTTDCCKVLAGWRGGYLNGDAWKMNSGITKVEDKGEYWHFHGVTGSVYVCHKGSQRVGGAMRPIYAKMMEHPEMFQEITVAEIVTC